MGDLKAFMDETKVGKSDSATQKSRAVDYMSNLVDALQEPVLVIDHQFHFICANSEFFTTFELSGEELAEKYLSGKNSSFWKDPEFQTSLNNAFVEKRNLNDLEFNFLSQGGEEFSFSLKGTYIENEENEFFLLSFKKIFKESQNFQVPDFKSLDSILAHAPAMICILRGPEFVFELANENYFQLIGKREIIGKTVREAIPEAEEQGFLELLEEVKRSGKAFKGFEIPIKLKINEVKRKNSFLDFIYQPMFDLNGNVDGIFVFATDVTEKVLVRKQIEQSEAELREIIDTVPAMIWITNEQGESVYLNKNWYDYTGQILTDADGFGWVEVTHPDDRKHAEESFREADKERRPFSASFRIKNKAGDYRWVIDSGRPKFSIDGNYEGMIGTVVDVHEEKIKEKELADTQHRYQELIHSSTSLISTFKGEDYIIEIANDAIIEAWGKGHDVIGKPLLEALPELVEQGFEKMLKDVYTTGIPFRGYEMPISLERNGKLELFHFNFIYSPQRDVNGKIIGIVNVATEVTSQALLNKTIRESESHFRQMADLMPTKVSNTNSAGEFIYFNQEWLDYTGLTVDQLKEKGWINLIHMNERKDFEAQWLRSFQTGVQFEMEVRCLNKSGYYKWHLSRAEPVKDESGNISMWISTNTEIQKLKEEEKRKGDFLKMVSHELKTPVTSIKGYVQLLLSMLRREESGLKVNSLPLKPSLERIDHQIKRLTRLISEMLDLSRIEENKLELKKQVFNLNELVNETVQDIRYTNTQHNIEIIPDYNCRVFGDKDRLGQVLINFITNAIKYSPESKDIMIRIRKHKNKQVSVSVKDQGIGIEKRNHKNIFKRFYRIGGKDEDTYSGFGIGLYLAQEIIERHNGSITVKSKKGKGSDFCFILSVA